jgi:hypothetical protein
LDALNQISELPVDSNDNPLKRVEIVSAKIIPREQVPPPGSLVAPAAAKKKPWWKIF